MSKRKIDDDDNDMDVDDKVVVSKNNTDADSKKNKAVDAQEDALLPEMTLLQLIFAQKQTDEVYTPQEKKEAKDKLLENIFKNDMAPFYEQLAQSLGWTVDEKKLKEMKSNNTKKLKELDDKIQDAVENFGETEVRDAHLRRAEYYIQMGDKVNAVKEYRSTFDKTIGATSKIDLILTLIRIGLFFDDLELVKNSIVEVKSLIESGGDWDRRNRLKVYEAYYLVSLRDFAGAAELFIATLSSFNASELVQFERFVSLAALCGLIALERAPLREKIADSPEMVAPRKEKESTARAVDALLNGEYRAYFEALVDLAHKCRRDDLLAPHTSFIIRELRVRGYVQLLSSYRSVKLSAMAQSFGVSEDFLDRELSRFIALGRVPCKIDRVGGVIEITRPDQKAALYHSTLKQGDVLLNRIQKLARVINM